jgi:hypothetical protein
MIDSFLLWLFIRISKLWFNSVVFGTDPETDRTSSISFFVDNEHAGQYMELLEKGRKEIEK